MISGKRILSSIMLDSKIFRSSYISMDEVAATYPTITEVELYMVGKVVYVLLADLFSASSDVEYSAIDASLFSAK